MSIFCSELLYPAGPLPGTQGRWALCHCKLFTHLPSSFAPYPDQVVVRRHFRKTLEFDGSKVPVKWQACGVNFYMKYKVGIFTTSKLRSQT